MRGSQVRDEAFRSPRQKVRIPISTSRVLTRGRVFGLLDAAATSAGPGSMLHVCAPAGAGKTTVLAGWGRRIERTGAYVAWVALDSEDNDVILLWSAIVQALQISGAWPQDGAPDQATLAQRRSGATFVAAVVASLEMLTKPTFLILDAVEKLHSREALRSLNFLLRHIPATLHIVLATRFPPPLILPRLRLEGLLSEIGPESLTFTRDEARRLYENEGIELDSAELDLLMERTEGWAAGLRLAAIAVAGAPEPADLITDFTGDDRVVADYLAGEVLAHQPEPVRRFLLSTSVCGNLTADLASVLSGQENAGQILDRLQRANILVSHRGRGRPAYRYHPLLRGYLRAELSRRRPSAHRDLHRSAAEWFLAAGDPLHALKHGIAANDDKLVTMVIGKHGLQQVLDGKASTLRCVLETAPAHVLARPSVALVAAAAALDVGDVSAADRCVHQMNDLGHPPRSQRLRALNATVRLHRARMRGGVREALNAMTTTRAGETGDLDLDLLTLMNRGIAPGGAARQETATEDLWHALHLATDQQHSAAVVQCRAYLAAAAAVEGDLAQVRAQVTSGIDSARAHGWQNTSRCAYLYIWLAAEAYQRLDRKRARKYSLLAVDLMPEQTDASVELFTLILRAAITFDTADAPHDVVAAIRRHWLRLNGQDLSHMLCAYTAPTELRMALRVGEYAWAAEVLERLDNLLPPCGEHALLQALLQAHKGKVNSARRLLAPVVNGQLPAVVAHTVQDAWLLEAHLSEHSGDHQGSHEAIVHALAMAEPQHVLRPFLDGGRTVRALLSQGTGRFGRLERFATTVVDVLPASAVGPTDGLTDRELTLLAELPSMQTTGEIAEALFVSINTIKTHLRGIYRKLGVNHRRDAITVARRRGLL